MVFNSDHKDTANGFNANYLIRKAFQEPVPQTGKKHFCEILKILCLEGSDPNHCGHIIQAGPKATNGSITSPGFPVKYSQNQICDWQIVARPGHQASLIKFD